MHPVFKEILAAAIYFLPGARAAAPIHAARMEEMRLLLTEAYADDLWRRWPDGARALIHLAHAAAHDPATDIPARAIGLACNDYWSLAHGR